MTRKLLCYAVGREGAWEAICLDLDIAVQGGSFEQVSRELREAIDLYLEEVQQLPEPERARFYHRSAPLSVRLRFLVDILTSLFGRKQRDSDEHHQFTMPVTA